jgi:hypothetical protein
VHQADDAVRLGREETVEPVLLLDRLLAFGPRRPVQGRQMPAKANSGRPSSRPNHTGLFFGLVSAYSLKDEAGTRQRNCSFSHGRQYGEAALRTFVTGCVPTLGGGGKPQRIMLSTRPSSRRRTTRLI